MTRRHSPPRRPTVIPRSSNLLTLSLSFSFPSGCSTRHPRTQPPISLSFAHHMLPHSQFCDFSELSFALTSIRFKSSSVRSFLRFILLCRALRLSPPDENHSFWWGECRPANRRVTGQLSHGNSLRLFGHSFLADLQIMTFGPKGLFE
jgi:hypothetical protein